RAFCAMRPSLARRGSCLRASPAARLLVPRRELEIVEPQRDQQLHLAPLGALRGRGKIAPRVVEKLIAVAHVDPLLRHRPAAKPIRRYAPSRPQDALRREGCVVCFIPATPTPRRNNAAV